MRVLSSVLTVLLITGGASSSSSSSRTDTAHPATGGHEVEPGEPVREEALRSSREFRYGYYFNQIKRSIATQWQPTDAIKRTTERLPRESFTELFLVIGKDGRLETAEVTRSSGVPSLDAEALRAVRAASPFAAPPTGVLDADDKLRLPFSFKVSAGGREDIFREPPRRAR